MRHYKLIAIVLGLLLATLAAEAGLRLAGMGFGKLFVFGGKGDDEKRGEKEKAELPSLPAPIVYFIAHNQILWIWAMSGIIGFVAFWFFATFAVAHGTRLARTLQTPYLKAVAALATLHVCMQMLVSYGDQQLTEYRTTVYLGLLLGTLVRLPAIERREAAEGKMS